MSSAPPPLAADLNAGLRGGSSSSPRCAAWHPGCWSPPEPSGGPGKSHVLVALGIGSLRVLRGVRAVPRAPTSAVAKNDPTLARRALDPRVWFGRWAARVVFLVVNISGNWLTDLALGGLNYQSEHHLFPSMPRPNLRRSQPLTSEFCRQHELPYDRASLLGSYSQALRHLHAIGAQARP